MIARTIFIPIFMGNAGPLSTADKIMIAALAGIPLIALIGIAIYYWYNG